MKRCLPWVPYQDDTHKSRGVKKYGTTHPLFAQAWRAWKQARKPGAPFSLGATGWLFKCLAWVCHQDDTHKSRSVKQIWETSPKSWETSPEAWSTIFFRGHRLVIKCLAWVPYQDDTHKSRSVKKFWNPRATSPESCETSPESWETSPEAWSTKIKCFWNPRETSPESWETSPES